MSNIQFQFTYYEPWMREQVMELFCLEYKTEKSVFTSYFDNFYFNPNHQPESVKVVALDGKTVAGFVSFTYWPYMVGNEIKKAVQCGNVIVNGNYRGKGLYNKMLDHFDSIAENHKIDFAIGFPIKPIIGLYMKNNWTKLLDIQWFVRPVNPLAGLRKFNESIFLKHFSNQRTFIDGAISFGNVYLYQTKEFVKWRDEYKPFIVQNHVYFLNYESNGNKIQFELKINERKKVRELMIGNINTNTNDLAFIGKAFSSLFKTTLLSGQISLLSIAINEKNENTFLYNAIKSSWFFKIKKDIFFIIKNYSKIAAIEEPQNWSLFRSDLDTW